MRRHVSKQGPICLPTNVPEVGNFTSAWNLRNGETFPSTSTRLHFDVTCNGMACMCGTNRDQYFRDELITPCRRLESRIFLFSLLLRSRRKKCSRCRHNNRRRRRSRCSAPLHG